MRKTSLYIEPAVDRALARRAASEGTTKDTLIRAALRSAASGWLRVKPRARGVFKAPVNLAENTDENLGKSGFGAS